MIQINKEVQYLKVLTEEDVKTVHSSTLKILEEIGIETDSPRLLKILADGGADVDESKKRIRFNPKLIEESIQKAPEVFKLCGQDSENDILLEKGRVHFGFGGTPTSFMKDTVTGEISRPTKKDVAREVSLGDSLSNVSFMMGAAGSYDKPLEVQYLHDLDAMFNNTRKHIVYIFPGYRQAKIVINMAETIVGKGNLKDRPLITLFSEAESPLRFSKLNENIIPCSAQGVPIWVAPSPLIGATGPCTLIGSFIVANAEALACVTMCQLINPGTPLIYGADAYVMDMRNARCAYSTPERALAHVMTSQMAHYYKMPSFVMQGAATDSKICDAQAGAETMMVSLMSALAGVNLIHNVGRMAGGEYHTMEMAVICNEVIGMIQRIIEGPKINDETIAFDVINEVGPGKDFLSHPHTLKWFKKELYQPQLFNRHTPDEWIKNGRKSTEQVAKEKVQSILETRNYRPLDESIKKELEIILENAEKELKENQ